MLAPRFFGAAIKSFGTDGRRFEAPPHTLFKSSLEGPRFIRRSPYRVSLSPEQQQKMLLATRGMASTLYEDVLAMSAVAANQKRPRSELRNLSNTLRRLLIYDDLKKVAAPRIGKFTVAGPNHSLIYEAVAEKPPQFFMSAGGWAFGVRISAFVTPPLPDGLLPMLSDLEKPPTMMRLDNFLAQNVIAFRGRWATRADVIKFVANKLHVHSSAPETDVELLLESLSHTIAFTMLDPRNTKLMAGFKWSVKEGEDDSFRYDPEQVNPLLLELLGAAHYLLGSPDMKRLMTMLKEELQPPTNN